MIITSPVWYYVTACSRINKQGLNVNVAYFLLAKLAKNVLRPWQACSFVALKDVLSLSEMIFKMKNTFRNSIKHNAQHFYHKPRLNKWIP
jgi:hypothetical protein